MIPSLLMALQLAGAAATDPTPEALSDSLRLDIQIPRLMEEVTVDGVLDEAVWGQAALLQGFYQYSPQDGIPAEESTRVRVWYAPDAIYFGVQAFAEPGSVRATLAERDRIDNDDQILILLDTFGDGRRATVFGVNPLGVQMDGIRLEGEAGRGGFFQAEAEVHPLDRNPDFTYESRGRQTEVGYEVEVRIPFKSLRYSSGNEQVWGLNIVRVVQASGRSHTWSRARRGQASFLGQAGTLHGLSELDRGVVLELQPELTGRVDGTPGVGDDWNYRGDGLRLGGNVTWGVSQNLTLSGSVRPDFSQVEADAGRLSYDPRRAISFPEKRPFFLEGSERFRVPNQLIYTRRIVQPDAAVKLNGELSGFQVGILSALDDPSIQSDGGRPLFNILRVQRDLGTSSTAGVLYTDRTVSGESNRVVGADARVVRGAYTLNVQGAGSFHRQDGVTSRGQLWDLGFERAGRTFGFTSRASGTTDNFITRTGFLSRTGTASVRVSPRWTRFGGAESRLESWATSLVFSGSWLHEAMWKGDTPEDIKFHWNNTFTFRGGWSVTGSLLLERFYYPPYLYTDYAVESHFGAVPDTVPFVGTPSIGNLDLVLNVATPQWNRLGGTFFIVGGRDENFDEWAPAYIVIGEAGLDWRPTDQVRVSPTYARQQYIRPGDGSTVRSRDLPRVKVEYQLTRAIFVRAVGQYDAIWRDALRDDTRTGDPILLRNPVSGVFERTTEVSRNDLQLDLLFAWQPTPGTVLFVGYANALSDPTSFGFRDAARVADGFFAKLSYRFQN